MNFSNSLGVSTAVVTNYFPRTKKAAAPGTYRVVRRIYDTVNAIEIFAGDLVQTSEKAWVKRLGSALEPVLSYGDMEDVRVIEGTVEAAQERREALNKPKPDPERVPEVSDKVEPGATDEGQQFVSLTSVQLSCLALSRSMWTMPTG